MKTYKTTRGIVLESKDGFFLLEGLPRDGSRRGIFGNYRQPHDIGRNSRNYRIYTTGLLPKFSRFLAAS